MQLVIINKITKTTCVKFVFHLTCCNLQDLQTEEVLAIARVIESPYVLGQSCFSVNCLDNRLNTN